MDLYEAIEVLEKFIDDYNRNPYIVTILVPEDIEAMKICLEAARDKAGV